MERYPVPFLYGGILPRNVSPEKIRSPKNLSWLPSSDGQKTQDRDPNHPCPVAWYGHGDLNPNAKAREPKSRMSTNSIMPANITEGQTAHPFFSAPLLRSWHFTSISPKSQMKTVVVLCINRIICCIFFDNMHSY